MSDQQPPFQPTGDPFQNAQQPTQPAPQSPTTNSQPQYQAPVKNNNSSMLKRGALVGAILVLGAGIASVFAFGVLDSGGFSTPESAGEAFFEALDQEDPLGVLQTIAPSEYEAWVEPQTALVQELVRLEVFSEDILNENEISFGEALEIEVVEPFEFESEQFFEETEDLYSLTVVAGEIEITVDEEAIADLFGENITSGEVLTTTLTFTPDSITSESDDLGEQTEDSPLELMAVKESGAYYLSITHTLGELIRAEEGSPKPSFEGRLVAAGADSPEEAMNQMMELLFEAKMEDVMATLDPEEFKAVYNYWSLLSDGAVDAERELDAFKQEFGVDWEVSFESDSESRDGRTQVWLTGMTAKVTGDDFDLDISLSAEQITVSGSGVIEGEEVSADLVLVVNGDEVEIEGEVEVGPEFARGSATINSLDQTAEVSGTSSQGSIDIEAEVSGDCVLIVGDVDGEPVNEELCDPAIGDAAIEDQDQLNEIFEDMEQLGFHAVERDGKWYIGGIPTFSYMAVDILRAIDTDEWQELDDVLSDIVGSQVIGDDPFSDVTSEILGGGEIDDFGTESFEEIEGLEGFEDLDFETTVPTFSNSTDSLVEDASTIRSCDVDENFGIEQWTAEIEFTNPLPEAVSSAIIDVNFIDSNGVVIGSSAAFFSNIEAGQTGLADAILFDEVEDPSIRCEIVGAFAY